MADVKPIPDGFTSVTPYMILPDCNEALEFYAKAFGAEKIEHMPGPDGKGTMHAEMKIGNAVVMMSDENPAWGAKSAKAFGGSPMSLSIYCSDCDVAFKQAVDAGCEATAEPADMFWGDRYGRVKDPFGFEWSIGTHIEDLTPEEIAERGKEFMAKMAAGGDPCADDKGQSQSQSQSQSS